MGECNRLLNRENGLVLNDFCDRMEIGVRLEYLTKVQVAWG